MAEMTAPVVIPRGRETQGRGVPFDLDIECHCLSTKRARSRED